jgi:long-chain acyl-CoA synthetase
LLPTSRPTLLLTGGTGLVGNSYLTERLKQRPDESVLVLTRKPFRHQHKNVTVWAADLTAPALGLSNDQHRWMHGHVTGVVHCAADIRFIAPEAESRAANVEATAELLELARRCDRLQQFVHVSTVYVAGLREGMLMEEELPAHEKYASIYQRTKHEAERLVLRAMAEIPACIYRLSSVAGSRCDHVQQLIRLAARNVFPCVPLHPQATVDLIDGDWAARALSHLIDSCFTPGQVLHVCAGPAHAVKATDLLSAVLERARAHTRPHLVSWNEFASALEKLQLTSGAIRALAPWLRSCAPHLAIRQSFSNSRLAGGAAGTGLFPVPFDLNAFVAHSLP